MQMTARLRAVAGVAVLAMGSPLMAGTPAIGVQHGDATASTATGEGTDVVKREPDGRATVIRPPTPVPAPASVTDLASRVSRDRDAAVAVAKAHLGPLASAFGARLKDLHAMRYKAVHGGLLVLLRQRVRGVDVLGAELAVWLTTDGSLRAIFGKASGDLPPAFPLVTDRQRRIAEDVAVSTAASRTGLADPAQQWEARLVGPRWYDASIWVPSPLSAAVPSLLYDVKGAGSAWHVLVEPGSGQALVAWSAHETLNRAVCDAERRVVNNTGAGIRCGDNQPFPVVRGEQEPPSAVTDVNSVFDYLGDTHDLYAALGEDLTDLVGVDYGDGRGKAIRATVRICQLLQCPYANAFWNGEQMAFGEGVTTDDVTGHELSHGVTEAIAPLTYLFEAGAINESLSDIFGELVDLTNGSPDDTPANRWLVGEGSSLGVIRSMADPPSEGDPDRMQSSLWVQDRTLLDNGGVHSNSGVGNKAAFLMGDGGTFNGHTVTPIGLSATARLFQDARALLPTGADYGILAEALRASCPLSLGSLECAEVEDALLATEMDLEPVGDFPAQAPICDTGSAVVRLGTDFSSTTGLVLDSRSWLLDSALPSYAYSWDGNGSAMGILRSPGAYSMTTRSGLLVPSGAPVYLRMRHTYALVTSSLGFPLRAGHVTMEYTTNNGSTWLSLADLPWVNGPTDLSRGGWTGSSGGWQTSRVDLSSLSGQPLRVRWTTRPSGVVPGAWWIDEARLYTCTP